MRVWAIGSIVFLWGTLGWGIADQLFWSPQGTPMAVVHQLARQVQLLAYGVMAAAGLMALLMTRVVYGFLRAPRQEDQG
jgi:hypothetical protein